MDDNSSAKPLPPADVTAGPDDAETMLSGTPAFEALFAALEHVPLEPVPRPGDQALLGLLAGSSLTAFG